MSVKFVLDSLAVPEFPSWQLMSQTYSEDSEEEEEEEGDFSQGEEEETDHYERCVKRVQAN